MLPEYIILHARVHTHNSSNGSILIIFLKYRCERMNETEREAPKKKKNAHTHTHAQTFVEHRITKQNKPKKKRTTIWRPLDDERGLLHARLFTSVVHFYSTVVYLPTPLHGPGHIILIPPARRTRNEKSFVEDILLQYPLYYTMVIDNFFGMKANGAKMREGERARKENQPTNNDVWPYLLTKFENLTLSNWY